MGDPGTLGLYRGPIDITTVTAGKSVQITLDNSLDDTAAYNATLAGGPAESTLSGLAACASIPGRSDDQPDLARGTGQATRSNVDFTNGNPLPSGAPGVPGTPNLDFEAADATGNSNALNLFGGGTLHE